MTPSIAATVCRVTVNGEPRELPSGSTVAALLHSLDRHPRMVAVERNGAIVRRADFDAVRIEAGDRLEIVAFTQGG